MFELQINKRPTCYSATCEEAFRSLQRRWGAILRTACFLSAPARVPFMSARCRPPTVYSAKVQVADRHLRNFLFRGNIFYLSSKLGVDP